MISCDMVGLDGSGATPDESIDIALTLDALAVSARTGAPADVGS